MTDDNAYSRIIKEIFFSNFSEGDVEVRFNRDDIVNAAKKLGISRPKNIGDVIYSFRGRRELLETIKSKAPGRKHWIIRSTGRSNYCFVVVNFSTVTPNAKLAVTKVPDSTPGVIAKYALNDEQALLAKLRYNRLVDIFTGVTCYSLQSHLRTSVKGTGQVETDELYIGIDKRGAQYVFPV